MDIFGYKEKEIEPHLVSIFWEDLSNTNIGNWKEEEDFIPKFPYGDDIWILFNKTDALEFSKKFELGLIWTYEFK